MTESITEKKLQALQSGTLTAEQNARAFLKAIKEKDKDINAFLEVDPERVIAEAKALDALEVKAKQKLPLFGLCIAVKAAINVTGYHASCASKTLEDYTATFDADAVRHVKDAGAIVIGIANCDEFCSGSTGENSAFGPTQNPAAPGFIPGGSSSGPAAAVAAGFCDLALGSDTGGSIRQPASHCGIVGIKPSYGRVSRYGLIDLSMSLDQIGPLAPDVEGAALLLQMIGGPSEADGAEIEEPMPTLIPIKKPKGITLGIIKELEELCADHRIWERMREKADAFARSIGGTVKEISMATIKAAVQAYYPIVYVEFFSGTRKLDGRKYGKKIEDTCGVEVLRRILGGREISRAEFEGVYYRKALAAKSAIAREFSAAFEEADVILTPVTPKLPYHMGEGITDPRIMYAFDAFTIPANLAGICGGVVPMGRIDDVPVGIQLLGKALDEPSVVSAMKALSEVD
ncbi:MAG: amidase family protein [archaeon]